MTWKHASNSSELFMWIGITLLVGFAGFFALMKSPPSVRKWVIGTVTFLGGSIYVVSWLWPTPRDRAPGELPLGGTEKVSFFLEDVVGQFENLSNTLTSFLLLLGVFSLVALHFNRVRKRSRDWSFSIVLLVTVVLMAIFGYADWLYSKDLKPEQLEALKDVSAQPMQMWMKDLMFDGLLQTMEAAMFSVIAFYIMSAAYRAFRVRSVEATILLSSALIVMLGLLGIADNYWSLGIDAIGGSDPNAFVNNLRLDSISEFIRNNLQAPGLRAIDFGVGVGALAMGLRLWLSLERGGTSN